MPEPGQLAIEEILRGYVFPKDAGPSWRAAHEAGVDLSLLEDTLCLSPLERLRDHQRMLDSILRLEDRLGSHDTAG